MSSGHAAPITTITDGVVAPGVPAVPTRMAQEATRARRVIGRLKSREDIAEILRMAKVERALAISTDDGPRLTRSVAIHRAAREALDTASARLQPPRYRHPAVRRAAVTSDALS